MVSKFKNLFKNLFKKNDLDEQRHFQNRVVKFLAKNFSDFEIEQSDDPLIIIWNENKLGLTNLYSNYLLSSQTNFEFEELTKEHFERIFFGEDLIEKDSVTFDEIKFLILPQLMPVEFTHQFKAINFPFGSEVAIGFVIDGEKAYHYITEDDVQEWDINKSEVYDIALENLADKSDKLEMTFVPPPNAMIVVNTLDSFDAVRILVPHMREFFGEKLGKSFFFGIPNRDFLICWSKESDGDFQNTIKNQVSNDFDERAYPLSRFVFEVNESDEIAQLDLDKSDITDFKGSISNN